jgi:hypothetical protein
MDLKEMVQNAVSKLGRTTWAKNYKAGEHPRFAYKEMQDQADDGPGTVDFHLARAVVWLNDGGTMGRKEVIRSLEKAGYK